VQEALTDSGYLTTVAGKSDHGQCSYRPTASHATSVSSEIDIYDGDIWLLNELCSIQIGICRRGG